MTERILILGATSAIAEACARAWAPRRPRMILAARGHDKVEAIAADLRLRGADVVAVLAFDGNDPAACADLVAKASEAMGGLDRCLVAHGSLTDEDAARKDARRLSAETAVNYVSAAAACEAAARIMEPVGRGSIVAVGSVAGDRGRASNYVYAAGKAALATHLSGLRARLSRSGVGVLTAKPGFVDTPMTAAFKKGPLWASPAQVAAAIVKASDKGVDVLYTPWFWFGIMAVIRSIPEFVFKKIRF